MESGKIAKRIGIGVAFVVALLAFLLFWFTVNSSTCSRNVSRWQAEYGHGVDRVVTLYSATGEEIGRWEGNIDVEYIDGRVDLVFFDSLGRVVDRVVINPGSGSVVVDQA
ncbi:MAG: hypothetical protein E7Z98_06430 [Olsenella sp.]|nr:hypothetical protein [Olsenella sp.]